MTDAQLIVVQQLPLIFLPLAAYLGWLAWRQRWGQFAFLLGACLAAAALICFGPLVGKSGHGAGWDGMAALIYFSMFVGEVISVCILAAVFAAIRRRKILSN
jgi:multisubunit Na+/H+ antiporter MnhE subunit